MKRKLVLMVFFLLFLTGCDGVYNLEIDGDLYKEDATIVENNSANWYSKNQNGVSFDQLLTEEYERDNDYYKKKLLNDDISMGLNYKYNFSKTEYSSMSIPSRCYEHFSVLQANDSIVISTSNKNLCYDYYKWLNNITINIKTNHKVLYHNADVVKDSTYTWNLNRQNASDKSIQIKLSQDYKKSYGFLENIINYLPIIVVAILVALIIGIIVFVVKIANSKANKI